MKIGINDLRKAALEGKSVSFRDTRDGILWDYAEMEQGVAGSVSDVYVEWNGYDMWIVEKGKIPDHISEITIHE